MVLSSIFFLMVDLQPQNCCLQLRCPQGEFHLSPVSLYGSLLSAGQYDPGIFHLAFVLVLRACEILCATFKKRIPLSCTPLALLKASPAVFQSQMF